MLINIARETRIKITNTINVRKRLWRFKKYKVSKDGEIKYEDVKK